MDRLRAILLVLPGVTEGFCYGTPGFYVNKKIFARMKEDGETLVVRTGDRENWVEYQFEILLVALPSAPLAANPMLCVRRFYFVRPPTI